MALVHLGCARNLIDSELILARLAEEHLMVTPAIEDAEVVVVNTCSFVGEARAESYARIEEQLERKRRGDLRAVVVAGCLVERYRRKLVEQLPDVDLFCEISDYRGLAKQVRGLAKGRKVPAYLEAVERRAGAREGSRLLATPGSYAYLRISHGCDHGCAFCAIPAMRGKHRSKRLPEVAAEAAELLEHGVKELVLVAEDSTAWGRDLGAGQELPDLVRELADLDAGDGDHTVRVMYAYPNRFPFALTELMRDHPRVLPYLDIPIQHAATDVLRGMRRHGSGDQVRKILDRLREEVPGITLRSTVLLGFPGETDAHVDELVELIEHYGLGRLGAFAYSPEEGTPAFGMEAEVPAKIARERVERVLAVRDRVLEADQRARVGTVVHALVDEVHPTAEGVRFVAHGDFDAPEVDPMVLFEHEGFDEPPYAVGDRVRVHVTDVDEDRNLWGDPVA
ncbi:MAG: 30S ribosomal protein S12 methylthiotransferase RimO [Planctomycetota bacterium]